MKGEDIKTFKVETPYQTYYEVVFNNNPIKKFLGINRKKFFNLNDARKFKKYLLNGITKKELFFDVE